MALLLGKNANAVVLVRTLAGDELRRAVDKMFDLTVTYPGLGFLVVGATSPARDPRRDTYSADGAAATASEVTQ